MNLMAYKSVIFDMDGVIFDSERANYQCWCDVAAQEGLGDISEMYQQVIGVNEDACRRIFLDNFGADYPYDAFLSSVIALRHARYGGGRMPAKPGALELLQALKAHGFRLALASSTPVTTVRTLLRDAGFLPFFDVVIGGDMVKRSKPAPDIFLTAAEALGSEPDDTYVIEDSHNGIRAAYSAGMTPIMVPDMLPVTAEMEEKAAFICQSLTDVMDILCVQ